MRQIILFALLIGALNFQLNAQNTVKLNINHLLGDAEFALDKAAKNNKNQDFNISRLQYYISEISLTHDGGKEQAIKDVWVLVDAANKSSIDLGQYEIMDLEKITLHIGVDPAHNHLDPSKYNATHPLAPKSPSMHWGWTAGYRFVALEGQAGEKLDQPLQLHGLGDNNYLKTEITLKDIEADNNTLVINLYADYTRALEDMNLSGGLIVHGDNFQAKDCLENFNKYVFSTAKSTNIEQVSNVDFSLYPNPVSQGFVHINFSSAGKNSIQITSVEGKLLTTMEGIENGTLVELAEYSAGLYFVHLVQDGKKVATRKIIIK